MRTYEGRAKRLIPVTEDTAQIFFKDESPFVPADSPVFPEGRGALASQISERLFEHLRARGLRTHHLGRIDARALEVRSLEMLPVEVMVRFEVAGSLLKRTGLAPLTPCQPPVVELYYKDHERGEPLLNEDHLRLLAFSPPEERRELREMAGRVAVELHRLLGRAGLTLVDVRLEFGRSTEGLCLGDELSPDTLRLRDAGTGEVLDRALIGLGGGDMITGYRRLLARLDEVLGESEGAPPPPAV